jgi:hypothetical protein
MIADSEERTSVCPKHNIILVRVVPALEEVKEEVPGLEVDITRVRAIIRACA